MGLLGRDVEEAIRIIPDYPKKGIPFKVLTTLWKDGRLTRRVKNAFERKW